VTIPTHKAADGGPFRLQQSLRLMMQHIKDDSKTTPTLPKR